jgi:hypothetical protein
MNSRSGPPPQGRWRGVRRITQPLDDHVLTWRAFGGRISVSENRGAVSASVAAVALVAPLAVLIGAALLGAFMPRVRRIREGQVRVLVRRPHSRGRFLWPSLTGIAVGAIAGFLLSGLLGTPREALRDAAALVPPEADAAPIGEFDYPFWYGATYSIRQEFSGGTGDRAGLASVVRRQLEGEGWRIESVEEAPGATLFTATRRDLSALVHGIWPAEYADVRGVITMRYREARPVGLMVGLGAMVGFAAGIALAAAWPSRQE